MLQTNKGESQERECRGHRKPKIGQRREAEKTPGVMVRLCGQSEQLLGALEGVCAGEVVGEGSVVIFYNT